MHPNQNLPEFYGEPNQRSANYHPSQNQSHLNYNMYNNPVPYNQYDSNYASVPSNDSFQSQSNRPRKKIFEYQDAGEPQMMYNPSPKKHHSPMKSNPPMIPSYQGDPRSYPPPSNYQGFHSNHYSMQLPPNQYYQDYQNYNPQHQGNEVYINNEGYNPHQNQHSRYVSDMHSNQTQALNRTPPKQRPVYDNPFTAMPNPPNSSYGQEYNEEGPGFAKQQTRGTHQSRNGFPQESMNNLNVSGNQGYPEPEYDNVSMYSATSSRRRTAPIVILNINVGNGVTEEIKLFDGEDPFEVAKAFCIKYNLPPNIHPVLVKNLSVQMNKFYELKNQKRQQRILNQTLQSQAGTEYDQHSMYQDNSHLWRKVQSEADEIDYYNPHQNQSQYNNNLMDRSPKSQRQPYIHHLQNTNETYTNIHAEKRIKSPTSTRNNNTKLKQRVEKENPFFKAVNKSTLEDHRNHNNQNDERSRPRTPNPGVFNKLYQQGMENKAKKESISQERKQQEELKDTTFHPNINKNSKYIAGKRQGKVEDDLLREAEYKQKRKEKAQLLKEILELENLSSPKPQALPAKKTITPKTERSKSPIQNKMLATALQKEILTKDSNNSKSTSNLNPAPATERSTQRTDGLQKKTQQVPVKKVAEERSVSPMDPKTNQPLFKPQINKNNPYYKNVATKNRDSTFVVRQFEVDEDEFRQAQMGRPSKVVGSLDLDESKSFDGGRHDRQSKHIQGEVKKNNKQGPEKEAREQVNNYTSQNNNPFLLNELHENGDRNNTSFGSLRVQKQTPSIFENEEDKQIITTIFQNLDSNRDGRISENDVDYSGLDADVLDVIKDIIFSLEGDTIMTIEDFAREIYKGGLIHQLRDLKGLLNPEVDIHLHNQHPIEASFSEEREVNDLRKDELDDILFGERLSGTSKSSIITTAESSKMKEDERVVINQSPSQQKIKKSVVFADPVTSNLTKRYQALAEKSFPGKTK